MDNQSFENQAPQIESVQHEQPTTEAPKTSSSQTASLSSVTDSSRSKEARSQEALQLQRVVGNQAIGRVIQKKENPTTPKMPPLDLSGLSGVIQRQEDSTSTTNDEVIQAKLKAEYHESSTPTVITTPTEVHNVKEGNKAKALNITMADWNTGSQPADNVRGVSRAATVASGKNPLYIAGHLLNHNIGGPGDDQRNITAFSNRANSKHLHGIEKFVKKDVQGGQTVAYTVEITERNHVQHGAPSSGVVKVENLASKMKAAYGTLKSDGDPDSFSGYDAKRSVTIDLAAGAENVEVDGSAVIDTGPSEEEAYFAIDQLLKKLGVNDDEYAEAFSFMNEILAGANSREEAIALFQQLEKSFTISEETTEKLEDGIKDMEL